MGAEITSRVQLSLIPGNQNLLIITFSNLQGSHVTFFKFIGKRNLHISGSLFLFGLSNILCVLHIIHSCTSQSSGNHKSREPGTKSTIWRAILLILVVSTKVISSLAWSCMGLQYATRTLSSWKVSQNNRFGQHEWVSETYEKIY